MRCERRLRTKLQEYKTNSPSKAEICDLFQTMKPCLHNHLQDSCGNSITRESFMGMFDALVSPCATITSDNQIEHNNIDDEVEVL